MYRVITETPRGEIVTEIPIEVEHDGPAAVEAFVAADVAAQLAQFATSEPDTTPEE